MIYHDLRSPLANIVSSLDVIATLVPENDRETVLAILKIADERGLLLLDAKDLRAMLQFTGENAAKFTTEYGNISAARIPMMAMTTRSSTRVKAGPRLARLSEAIHGLLLENLHAQPTADLNSAVDRARSPPLHSRERSLCPWSSTKGGCQYQCNANRPLGWRTRHPERSSLSLVCIFLPAR